MSDVKWIKIATDIFEDEKILIIESMPEADAIIVIWIKLLCLAGKQNNSGVFRLHDVIFTDEMLAAIFRKPVNTVQLALKTFENLGMIEYDNGVVVIPSWGKHQNLEKIAARKESRRIYMQRYREKQKLLAAGGVDKSACKTDVTSHVTGYATGYVTGNEDARNCHVTTLEGEGDPEERAAAAAAAYGDERPGFDTLEVYASSNLQYLSPHNMDELVSFKDELPEDVIRWAIDDACAHGAPRYSYVRSILNRLIDDGIKTLGDVKARADRNNTPTDDHSPPPGVTQYIDD